MGTGDEADAENGGNAGNSNGSRRIEQIVDLAAEGRTDKEIALTLGISSHTVSTHWKRLRASTGANNRTAAVLASLRERIELQNQALREANEALRQAHESSRDGMAGLVIEAQRRLAEALAQSEQERYLDRASRLCRFVVYKLRSLVPVEYTFVSPSMEQFGHDYGAMLSAATTFYDLIFREDLPCLIEKSLGASYPPGEAYVFTYRLRMPEPRWVMDRHQALYDDNGKMTGILGVVFDIHELAEQGIVRPEVSRTIIPARHASAPV